MIRSLTIQNVALIENISIHFHPGMNVLSGETGAGKSIIVDAVNLILGGRADRDLIRTGCERASVEAEFEAQEENKTLEALFGREQISYDNNMIVLYREISQTGRNICRINGVIVTLAVLKETAVYLLNLHGQSEHQFLADKERHLFFLDLMGDNDHLELQKSVEEAYRQFIANHRAYAKLVKLNENKEVRTEIVRRELEEFRRISLNQGEEERLAEEARAMQKSSRIHDVIIHAALLLGRNDEGADAMNCLKTAARELHGISMEDESFDRIAEQCEVLYYNLEEILYALDHMSEKYDFNPEKLEMLENRLESVRRILLKYGPTEEDALRKFGDLEQEYDTLTGLEDQLKKTGSEHKMLLVSYRNAARTLSAARKKIADEFEKRMIEELSDLGMEQTVFKVVFELPAEGKPLMPTSTGDDRICFMFSPNPGEPMKPISTIASGGELSRLMLAIKTIESGRSGHQTMIFDEIDTGISGRIAQAVAEKMRSISMKQQVICISHLPQIAAAADYHYLVYKGIRDGRTYTDTIELNDSRRIDEVARMISGAQGITDDAKHYAERMITASRIVMKPCRCRSAKEK